MYNPHEITREFEKALCEYTGAPFAVVVNSCTMALLLACAWYKEKMGGRPLMRIPKKTYLSVPQSILHAGCTLAFHNDDWEGLYQLRPAPIWDCARTFTSGMYNNITAGEIKWRDRADKLGKMQCLSFHSTKILGDTQGGAILHDDPESDVWLRKARFDGRTEGVPANMDHIDMLGHHCYLSPDVSARLLWHMQSIPEHNPDLPNDDYPDLSKMEIFR